jgi:methyltransferase
MAASDDSVRRRPARRLMLPIVLFVLAFVPMIGEAVWSARNERTLRAAGAIEPAGDVYRAMQFAYPASFAAMTAEAWWRAAPVSSLAIAGVILFGLAKTLKYWAIGTLGSRWTFRVLVPPGSHRITAGPYRLLRHPNYLAVAGELVGMALMARAGIAGPVAIVLFGALMFLRIRTEERALGSPRG